MMGGICRLLAAGAVVVAVMGISVKARADFKTGQQLYDACTSTNAFDRGRCAGYVEAISDASRKYFDPVFGYTNCLPRYETPWTSEQVTDIVVRFLASHPAETRRFGAPGLDSGAAGLVAEALAYSFPCK